MEATIRMRWKPPLSILLAPRSNPVIRMAVTNSRLYFYQAQV